MRKVLSSSLLSLAVLITVVNGQNQEQTQKQPPIGDVLRINTELVQTDVMVFDRDGRFVDGLDRSQFELRVDGKPMPISFFERVAAGSSKESALVEAARSREQLKETTPPASSTASDRSRTIIFFIDDMHLSPDSVIRTRKALLNFINTEMGLNDQVAIASATGQIGFLQQLTNNKAVLRAAVGKLVYRPFEVRDVEQIKMTEYQALRVEQGDSDVLNYYVTQVQLATKVNVGGRMSGPSREQIAKMVRERAKFMLRQSASITIAMFKSLEFLMRSIAQLPNRKLIFFLSDGFYLDDRNSDARDRLQYITDAATRTGAVIYSLDVRGLILPEADASNNRVDPIGQLTRANSGEVSASQDPLNALAVDTGGRAQFNTFALSDAINRALKETSNYYLLAWRPESEEQRGGKFRKIEVRVAGRPELSVRLPRGFMEAGAKAATNEEASKNTRTDAKNQRAELQPADRALSAALAASVPVNSLSTKLGLSYLDVPERGWVLTASTQVAAEDLDYGADGKQAAEVDVAGVALNEQGKVAASFKTRLNIRPVSTNSHHSGVIYSYKAPLAPGIYQVRVAARDEKRGRVGSAMQWIEIPDLAARRLTLSSLLIGEESASKVEKTTIDSGTPEMQFSIDRRFKRSSKLSFFIFVYNAARKSGGSGAPDLTAQVQIFRGGQAIVSTPQRSLTIDPKMDVARIPYAGSFPLAALAAGRYILQVTITDRSANTTASERVGFEIE